MQKRDVRIDIDVFQTSSRFVVIHSSIKGFSNTDVQVDIDVFQTSSRFMVIHSWDN